MSNKDFYARKYNLVVVERRTKKEGLGVETLEGFVEMNNLKVSLIETIGFCVGNLNVDSIQEIHPQNLQNHLSDISYLIMSLSNGLFLESDHLREKLKHWK